MCPRGGSRTLALRALTLALLASCGRIGYDGVGLGPSDGGLDGAPRPDGGLPPDGAPPPDGAASPAGVSTFAGGAVGGEDDGPGGSLSNPVNVAVAPDGDLYVADWGNGAIRRVTPAGIVETVVRMPAPFGLAITADGALVVTTDEGKLNRVDVRAGSFTTVADMLGLSRGVAVLPDGGFVVSGSARAVIWRIDAAGGKAVLAGSLDRRGAVDETGGAARFDSPVDIVRLSDGTLAVADLGSCRIRRVTLAGVVSTIAGSACGDRDGPVATATFRGPSGLAVDAAGTLFITDRYFAVVRKLSNGVVTTIAGDGTPGYRDAADPLQARFHEVEGADLSADGRTLYIADGNGGRPGPYHRIRQLRLAP